MPETYITKKESTLRRLHYALRAAVENSTLLLAYQRATQPPSKGVALQIIEQEIVEFKQLADTLLDPEPNSAPPPAPPPPPQPWSPPPVWTITFHAADGTCPCRAFRHPGDAIRIEGDPELLIGLAGQLAFLAKPHPN